MLNILRKFYPFILKHIFIGQNYSNNIFTDKDHLSMIDNKTFKFVSEATVTNFGALKEILVISIPSAAALLVRRMIELGNYHITLSYSLFIFFLIK